MLEYWLYIFFTCFNDAAEKLLGLAVDPYTNFYPKTKAELQAFYKMSRLLTPADL